MAKKVIWPESAKIGRRLILEYWNKRTGNKKYSQSLSGELNERILSKRIPRIRKGIRFS